jgi:hypothetical protein
MAKKEHRLSWDKVEAYRLEFPEFDKQMTENENEFRTQIEQEEHDYKAQRRKLQRELETLLDRHNTRCSIIRERANKKEDAAIRSFLDSHQFTSSDSKKAIKQEEFSDQEDEFDLGEDPEQEEAYPCTLRQYLLRYYLIINGVPADEVPAYLDPYNFAELLVKYNPSFREKAAKDGQESTDRMSAEAATQGKRLPDQDDNNLPELALTKKSLDSYIRGPRKRLFNRLDLVLGAEPALSHDPHTRIFKEEPKRLMLTFQNCRFFDVLLTENLADDQLYNYLSDESIPDKKKCENINSAKGNPLIAQLKAHQHAQLNDTYFEFIQEGLRSLIYNDDTNIDEKYVDEILIKTYHTGLRKLTDEFENLFMNLREYLYFSPDSIPAERSYERCADIIESAAIQLYQLSFDSEIVELRDLSVSDEYKNLRLREFIENVFDHSNILGS